MNNENPYDSLIWLRRRLKIAIAIRRVCICEHSLWESYHHPQKWIPNQIQQSFYEH